MSKADDERKLKELEREVSEGESKPKKKKRKQRVTSDDVPGDGMAKDAAKAIEKRKKRIKSIKH